MKTKFSLGSEVPGPLKFVSINTTCKQRQRNIYKSRSKYHWRISLENFYCLPISLVWHSKFCLLCSAHVYNLIWQNLRWDLFFCFWFSLIPKAPKHNQDGWWVFTHSQTGFQSHSSQKKRKCNIKCDSVGFLTSLKTVFFHLLLVLDQFVKNVV